VVSITLRPLYPALQQIKNFFTAGGLGVEDKQNYFHCVFFPCGWAKKGECLQNEDHLNNWNNKFKIPLPQVDWASRSYRFIFIVFAFPGVGPKRENSLKIKII
jgi:hypothetical protein